MFAADDTVVASGAKILIVDDEPGLREFMVDTLSTEGHYLVEAPDGNAAVARLRSEQFDLLITDLRMPGGLDGMDVVREARRAQPAIRIIVLTAYGSVATAVDAMKLGAVDFLEKPVSSPVELRILVSRALKGGAAEEEQATGGDPLQRQLVKALGGGYQVEGLIGQGGYAAVYGVLDRGLRRTLAAKVLLPEFAAYADTADRFRREARVMARLSHPNIMPVHFVGREEDVPFFVMPRIHGSSVGELLAQEGPFPVARVLRIAEDVAAALDAAHAAHVIHRDVKPANILVEASSGRAILTDFGISKAVATDGAEATTPGMFLGTPRYASPEQIAGEVGIDVRTDIYSFAVVVYEMLSGRPPFEGPGPSRIAKQHLFDPVPSIAERIGGGYPALDAVMQRAMAKDPAHRTASAGAFVRELKAALT